MQQNDETRFEDFVGLISGLYKEIQRIKASEGARLGLKGSDIMCLYYLALLLYRSACSIHILLQTDSDSVH